MTEFLNKNRWGLGSVIITVGNGVVIFSLVEYLYRQGLWGPMAHARVLVSVWGALSLFLSFAASVVGLVKDTSKALAIGALLLSLCSFAFYAQ
jgi:hypothetical protein